MNSIMKMFLDQAYQKGREDYAKMFEATRGMNFEEARREAYEEARREAYEEARREAYEEGRQIALQKAARQLASVGFTPEKIAHLVNSDLQQVKEWLK